MIAEPHTIAQLARALQARETTSRAVTQSCLEAIADKNPTLNAFIAVLADEALVQADDADREIQAGRSRGPLHGVPISIKDLIDLRGTPTTAASRVREPFRAAADAPAIAHLRNAGAVFVGKCNLHEFAFGTTNEDSAFGPARHPLDPSRSPGGSSGGSAISVATGMAFASIGTDTGGSIRIPAAACGLVGLKPGLGEVSTEGVVPLSRTMDHVGPLCRCVGDAAILYDALRGAAAHDAPPPPEIRKVRLAVPREYFLTLLDPQVAAAFDSTCDRLRSAGATLQDVTFAHANDIAPIYLHIVLAEAAAYHAKTLDARPDDYTPNVRLRLEMGRYILAGDYVRALRGRDVLTREVDAALAACDALLLPTLAIPAPKLGTNTVKVGAAEEPVRSITLRLTQLFNVTGHPALTAPCGNTTDRLPVGAQLVGRRGATRELLQLARSLEPYLTPGGSC
jgi:aspartyl-tRNA(Asn)/glutamyl-tRNA(Gln) amidotransferase subunit A